MTPGGSAGRLVMTFSSSSGGRGSSPVGPGGQDCDEAGWGHAPMRSGPGPAGDFITAAGRADRSRQRHRAAGRGKGQTRPAAAHPYSQSRPQTMPTAGEGARRSPVFDVEHEAAGLGRGLVHRFGEWEEPLDVPVWVNAAGRALISVRRAGEEQVHGAHAQARDHLNRVAPHDSGPEQVGEPLIVRLRRGRRRLRETRADFSLEAGAPTNSAAMARRLPNGQNSTDMNVPTCLRPTRRYAARAASL